MRPHIFHSILPITLHIPDPAQTRTCIGGWSVGNLDGTAVKAWRRMVVMTSQTRDTLRTFTYVRPRVVIASHAVCTSVSVLLYGLAPIWRQLRDAGMCPRLPLEVPTPNANTE